MRDVLATSRRQPAEDDLRPALLYLFGLWLSFEKMTTDVSVVVVGGQRGKQLCPSDRDFDTRAFRY
jgi:hypothetical protein